MKEFINKLIESLEEYPHGKYEDEYGKGFSAGINASIEEVNQLAEEYINTSTDTSTDTSSGWIEKLLEAKGNCSEDSYCPECPFGQIEYRCILAELQIEGSKNNGWVPCSERLPEANKDVLVCTNAGQVDVDYYGEYIKDFIGLKGTEQYAIAWQSLPAPYKEGATENE